MSSGSPDVSGTGTADRSEFLRSCLSDFRRFAGLVHIIGKSGARIPFRFNDIQKQYCSDRTQRDVVLKPRQIGFTTLEQVRDVYCFLTKPGAKVVTTCQSLSDHSPKLALAKNYTNIFDSLRRAGIQIPFSSEASGYWAIGDRTLSILEAGASQASAEKKGRAGTVTRLHSTETAFYEYAESTLNALLECVPGPEHGSEVVFESTPNGASGVFYHQCRDAQSRKSGYKLHFYPWFAQREYALPLEPEETVSPRSEREAELVRLYGISPAQLKWYQRKLSDKSGNQDKMDQEYPSDPNTCFLVSGRNFFDAVTLSKLLNAATLPTERREKGQIRIWVGPEYGRRYIISADPSEGAGGDPGAAIVYRDDGVHCATVHGQFPTWEMARVLVELGKHYNWAVIIPERNNHGHAVIQAIVREFKYRRVYSHYSDKKLGWPTDTATRPMMLDELEASIRSGVWQSKDQVLLDECQRFKVNDVGKPEAEKGAHDDLVMAAAIGWAVLNRPKTYRDLTNLPPV